MSQPDKKDSAREVKPVVMFDSDKEGKHHPEFPPISNYVEKVKEREKHFVKDDERDEGDEMGEAGTEPRVTQEDEQPPAPEPPPAFSDPEPEPEEDALPPEPSPEPVEDDPSDGDDSNSTVDDIPSPWDEPTSD